MAVDPFDDFEFQPLTEGLGFHKKAEKIKTDIQSSQLAKDKVTRSVPEAPPRSVLSSSAAAIATKSTTSSATASSLSSSITASFETDSLSARPATQSISELIASLPPSLDFLEEKEEPSKASPLATPLGASKSAFDSNDIGGRPQIFQPLGRDDYRSPSSGSTLLSSSMPSSSSLTPPAPTVGTYLPSPGTKAGGSTLGAPAVPVVPAPAAKPSSPYRERMDESFARAFPHAEKTKRESTAENDEEILPVAAHPVAAILDGMVAAGITTILLVAIIAITRINLVGMLSNAETASSTQLNLALLFLAVIQMYMLTARSFFGATLGEWAFDLQLGSAKDQKATWYPVQVAWRMIVVTLTGLFVLPLISLIARRDLLKYITGLQLYRRP